VHNGAGRTVATVPPYFGLVEHPITRHAAVRAAVKADHAARAEMARTKKSLFTKLGPGHAAAGEVKAFLRALKIRPSDDFEVWTMGATEAVREEERRREAATEITAVEMAVVDAALALRVAAREFLRARL
jgi:hypothetical protein